MNSRSFRSLPLMATGQGYEFAAKSRITEPVFFKALRIACSSLLVLVTVYAVPARAQQSDSHYVEIRQLNGRIVSIELIRSADGAKIGVAHPYPASVATLNSLPVERMSVAEFQQLAKNEPPPPAASSGYATGLAIGYNDSVGATPGLCYNFTAQKVAVTTNSDFQVTDSISSIAQSTNVSSSAQASYDAFSASNDFSYSDSYNATSNSGSAYLSASSTTTISNAPDPNNVLNTFGSTTLNSGTFGPTCGAAYMNTVLGGMSVIGRVNWASSSSTQAQKFQDTFTTGVGLDSLSTAVTEAQTVSHQSFSCGFSLAIIGGGKYANGIMSDLSSNTASLTQCCNGTSSACTTFSSNMDVSIATNVGGFDSYISNANNWPSSGAVALDSLGVMAFPEGLAGIGNPRTTTPASTLAGIGVISDPWQGMTSQLQNYLTVLNQIRTLQNRAKALNSAVGTTYNPTQLLNLQNYLTALNTGYGGITGSGTSAAPKSMLANLKTCLQPPPDTDVGTDCASIVQSAGITTAYDMFGPTNYTGANQWLLQQNTVALQYTGIFTNTNGYVWPMDVMYIDVLPSFTGQSALTPIALKAALTGFSDAPFYDNGETKTIPAVALLPMWPNSALTNTYPTASQQGVFLTPNTFKANRSSIPADIPQPGLWYGIGGESPWQYSNDDMISWTTAPCTPSFGTPCGIGYAIPKTWMGIDWGGYPLSLSMTQIADLFDSGFGSSDVNGDGKIDCADLAIIKSPAFGKKTGQLGFDRRADVNRDGVVDIQDWMPVFKQVAPAVWAQCRR